MFVNFFGVHAWWLLIFKVVSRAFGVVVGECTEVLLEMVARKFSLVVIVS